MKVAVATSGACQRELKVEVAPDAVAAAREEVYRQLQRVARVPGFRVGHAPRELVAQHYATRAREETIRRVITESLPKAVQETKLDVLGDPEVTQVALDDGKPLTFIARCEIMPAIKLRGVKGLKITRPKVLVTDARVEEVLARLQEQRAELTPVPPRPVVAGDYVVVDFSCTVGEKVVERRQATVLGVKPEEDTSGISRHLVGATPGPAAITFDTTLPADLPAKEYAGKPATFAVTLKELKTKQVPPLDEAFAKLLGVESLEALRARVRQDLERELTAQARRATEEQIGQALLAQHTFDVPASLVQSQAQRMLQQAQLRLVYQGIPPEEIEQRRQLLVEESKRDALKQVKLFFLLRQVAKERQLAVTEAEIEQRIQAMAASSRRPPEQVRAELAQQRLLSELTWDITRGKVFDALVADAIIQEVTA